MRRGPGKQMRAHEQEQRDQQVARSAKCGMKAERAASG
jgi:hypothetical protein